MDDREKLVERVAIACREAYAKYNGDDELGLVPWEQSETQEAWRIVASAALATVNSSK